MRWLQRILVGAGVALLLLCAAPSVQACVEGLVWGMPLEQLETHLGESQRLSQQQSGRYVVRNVLRRHELARPVSRIRPALGDAAPHLLAHAELVRRDIVLHHLLEFFERRRAGHPEIPAALALLLLLLLNSLFFFCFVHHLFLLKCSTDFLQRAPSWLLTCQG